MNRACYPINTQMNSNICNASIFTNSFISSPNNRVRIQDENHKKQINTCLIKEDNGIYWYIYKFCVIICIKLNSSSLQVLYLYKRGELLMNQRKSLKELNLLDKFLFDEAMDGPGKCKDDVGYHTESEYESKTSGAGVNRIDRIIEVYGT